ncbi:hypothetical protein [Parvibaculum sp.]|uniref:hypothetical protein n=1 Tax=Parvibaculum sp. TaxID=2024848 RepID=UPI001D3BDF23|nr:hypothetical protein [Parvibaculum sp.]MBX3488856.1 hypothetical protein [Parvibaculum sp.]
MKSILIAGADDKPVAGVRAGTVAVYEAGSQGKDHGPAIAPYDNLADVDFHTDFDYLRVTSIVTSRDAGMSSISLPATAWNSSISRTDTLFAHGLGYKPLLSADIEIGSYVQPAAGTINPLPGGNTANVNKRFIYFVADTTNVYMRTRGWVAPSMTVHWVVRVYAERFQTVEPGEYLIDFDPAGLEIAQFGKIDSEHRFVREVASGPGDFRLIGKRNVAHGRQSQAPHGTVNKYGQSDGATDWAWLQATSGVNPVAGTATISVDAIEAAT